MSSAPHVLRQAEALKANVSDSGKSISETWVARQRLEDLYKKLLLMDLEYALDKKVEQDLWNHAFKNHINNLQSQTKDKQNPKRGEVQATLNLFLETASGFYLQLLQLICTTFKLDLPFRRKSSCYGIMKERTPLKVKITPPKKSSCLYVCQHCLVHLGDIARYRQQVDQAQTYYWHAANLVPFNGQPYNQLAIVEAARGNKLSTVFYYIRSLAVRHPFPAAATNLEKLYTKIAKDAVEFKGKLSVSEMITAFLQFQAYIHLCTELSRAAVLSEKLVSALPAHVTSQSFPSHILVQITAINIFSMQHARRQMSDCSDDFGEQLSMDEEKSFSLMFHFTISILDVLLQYTPKQEQKIREFFTLPAVKLLLDWLKLNPEHYSNPSLKSSSLMGNFSKVLNNIQTTSTTGKDGEQDKSKYDELPLSEDVELRCFQPLEKSQSCYSYSRVPSEGLSQELETQIRCKRLLEHGKCIAEQYPSLNLLNIQTTKAGKIQFSAPAVQVKVLSGGDNSQSSPEKRLTRQNVAIQAIIQKQSEDSKGSGDKLATKNSEKVKVASSSNDSAKSNYGPGGPTSPKYLLGVPTSEPLFMKSGSGTKSATGQQGSGRSQQQQPPRFQQKQLAQQQASQGSSPQQLSPWQQDASSPQQPQILQSPSSAGVSPQPKPKGTLWQPSPEPKISRNALSQETVSQPPRQQKQAHQQPSIPRKAVPQDQPQPQKQQQITVMQSDFRSSPRFPGNTQPSSQQSHQGYDMMGNPRPSQSQNSSSPHINTTQGGTPFRPAMNSNQSQLPMHHNERPPPPLFPSDVPPPPLFHGERPPPPLLPGERPSMPLFPGDRPPPPILPGDRPPPPPMMPNDISRPNLNQMNQDGGKGSQEMSDLRQPQQQFRMQNPPFPGFPPNQNLQNKPGSGSSNQNQGLDQFQRNQLNQFFANQLKGPSFQGNQMNFPQAPGTERMGQKQQQDAPMPPFPNPLFNPLAAIMGRFSSPQSAFMGSHGPGMDPQRPPLMRNEDFKSSPMDILGALSQLAIQPPKIGQENFLTPNRQGSSFQGHAEGTPKPDLGSSPNRSPKLPPEQENRQGNHVSIIQPPQPPQPQQQQGTYSLFSSSPWSVPLSTAENKSIASSPFSSEASSMRNTPDPPVEVNSESKMGHGLDLGLRFGSAEEQWVGKSQPQPVQIPENMGNNADSDQGPYFPSTLQSIWSSPGPSPLERLLEMQKQQRQTDPH